MITRIFVSFWAMFDDIGGCQSLDTFVGNCEVTARELGLDEIVIQGIESVVMLEEHIRDNINKEGMGGRLISSISIINWRSF